MNHNTFTIENGELQQYCGYEKTVEIPAGVTGIATQAFIEAGDTIESIIADNGEKEVFVQSFAFEHCYVLKRVYLGANVILSTFDGLESIFYCCDALECIEVSPEHPLYSSKDGVLYNKDMTEVLYDPADKYWLTKDGE